MKYRTDAQFCNEVAVSPTIGVVLMVAITVILAALIASVLFGMVTNIPKTKTVAATVTQSDAFYLIVTYHGGQDQKTCVGIRWDLTDSTGSTQMTVMGHTSPSYGTPLEVGSELTVPGSFQGKDHVIATAYFMDGTQQVILDNFI